MESSEAEPSGLCTFGAQAIEGYLTILHGQLQGALDAAEVEFVHQSRVYSRRLRATLGIFADCFDAKQIKRWNRSVRAVTRSLGAARDLDVQILFLNEYMKERNDLERGPLDLLLQEMVGRRAEVQPQVEVALAQFEAEGMVDRWHAILLARALPMNEAMWQEVRVAALVQVLNRTRELLTLSDSVADEKAIERHHQMRIAAKRLRYTLETFSPAYEDGLRQSISRLKKLQDVLGEMHDCDVWIALLTEKLRWRCDPALAGLLLDRQEHRGALYQELGLMWSKMVEQRTLNELERKLRGSLQQKASEVALPDLSPPSKVALIADVHANLPALEAVMEDATDRGAVVFLNAGDSIGWGPYNNEVLQFLQDGRFLNVVGNYDQNILAVKMGGMELKGEMGSLKEKVAAFTVQDLNKDSMTMLLSLPEELRLFVAGKKVLLTHASPVSIEEPVHPGVTEARMEELAGASQADLVILGHTHRCLDRSVSGVRFINPGSVGRPMGGDARASYALLDPSNMSVEFVRVPYNLDEIADHVLSVGLPKRLSRMYLSGRSPDEPEEKVHPQSQLGIESKLHLVEEVAQSHGHLDAHSLFVRSTAMQIFDHLRGEHRLDERERYWLECGALLHDIGWSKGAEDHNRSSFNMVLVEDRLPLDEEERLIVASLTRYHRKGLPSKDHANYRTLDRKEQRKVDVLAGILRVADGLDVRHNHDVRLKGCWTDPHLIIMEVEAPQEHRYEIEAGLKKGKLLEKAFDRKLMIR